MGGAVKLITTVEDWQTALTHSKGFGGKAFIIDFTASWCGPCQRIAPIYEQLSGEFPGVTFYKCDVDEVQEVAAECGVRAMPTFVGYFNGEKVGECVGADINKIKELITLLNNKSGMMGTGQKLGGSAAASAPAGEDTPEQRRARMLAAAEARSKAQ